jgi:hypothetical protein
MTSSAVDRLSLRFSVMTSLVMKSETRNPAIGVTLSGACRLPSIPFNAMLDPDYTTDR